MQNDAKKFFKEINQIFPMHRKKEKDYLKQLNHLIENYTSDKEKPTYDDYVEEFGSPVDIAASYYQTLDTQELIKALNRKFIMKIISISVTLVCLFLLIWKLTFYYQAYQEFQNALPSYRESVTEIIE